MSCLLLKHLSFNLNTIVKGVKPFSTTSIRHIKEIRETTDGNVTVIEGIIKESPRKDHLIQLDTSSTGCCPLCRLNLDLQHTDVLILGQFLRSDGRPLSRRVSGLCGVQQHLITNLVKQAVKAGLITQTGPPARYKKLNRYFEPKLGGSKTKRYT